MASIAKTGTGWRAQLYVNGQRDSKVCDTKREAQQWAAEREAVLRAVTTGRAGTVKTLADAFDRYGTEVSSERRGWRAELIRLEAFRKHPGMPVRKKLSEVTTADIAMWRDARLAVNARGSVLRDLGLLSAVFEVARRDWQWVTVNPVRDVRKPANPDHRTRVVTWRETKAMLRQLGHGGPVRSVTQAVALCFLVALHTGMRAGELCGLTWDNVFADYCRLPMTKNGKPREVPLTPRARRLIERMRGFDSVLVFGLKSQSLDALFRKARERAGLSGFTFHDGRHTAATMLARRLDVLTLCKVFGWAKTDQALTYFNPTASDISKRLR